MSGRTSIIRVLGFGVLGLCVAACASEASDTGSSDEMGGQTGSLIPKCLLTDTSPFVVPVGDTAFAQQVSTELSATLTDAMGNDVPLTETREGNTSILRTDQALTPGSYTLTDGCAQSGQQVIREIVVVEAAPLPASIGSIEATPVVPPFCSELHSVRLSWTPAADFVPYVNLTELTLYQGNERLGVIPQTQPYELNGSGSVEVTIPLCPDDTTCLPGAGEYRIEAQIAGEEGSWPSATLMLDPECKPDPVEGGFGCSVTHTRPRAVNTWPAALLPFALWLMRRRSKGHLGDSGRP